MRHYPAGTLSMNGINQRMFEEETVRAMWAGAHALLLQTLKVHPSYERLEKFLTLEQFLLHLGYLPLMRFTYSRLF
jgi:hypothetical protein